MIKKNWAQIVEDPNVEKFELSRQQGSIGGCSFQINQLYYISIFFKRRVLNNNQRDNEFLPIVASSQLLTLGFIVLLWILKRKGCQQQIQGVWEKLLSWLILINCNSLSKQVIAIHVVSTFWRYCYC